MRSKLLRSLDFGLAVSIGWLGFALLPPDCQQMRLWICYHPDSWCQQLNLVEHCDDDGSYMHNAFTFLAVRYLFSVVYTTMVRERKERKERYVPLSLSPFLLFSYCSKKKENEESKIQKQVNISNCYTGFPIRLKFVQIAKSVSAPSGGEARLAPPARPFNIPYLVLSRGGKSSALYHSSPAKISQSVTHRS